jgi:hypothetical protein
MEVIFSERGKELIHLESFKYTKKSATKQGVKWCCTVKSCNARIYAAIRPCPFLPECYHCRNPAITFPGTF